MKPLTVDWVAHEHLTMGDATQIPLFLEESTRKLCIADLTKASWVGPATLVALAAHLDRNMRESREACVLAPADHGLANYISRMGFGKLLSKMKIEHNLPTVSSDLALNAKSLVEISRFSSEAEVSDLIEILTYRRLDPDILEAMCEILSEMGNNVPQHSRVEYGFMGAQVVNNGHLLRVSVADGGVGLRATLSKRGAETDRQALSLALNGQSEIDAPGRGRGFLAMQAAVRKHGGYAHLLSGKSRAVISPSSVTYWTYQNSYMGTVFDAALPILPLDSSLPENALAPID